MIGRRRIVWQHSKGELQTQEEGSEAMILALWAGMTTSKDDGDGRDGLKWGNEESEKLCSLPTRKDPFPKPQGHSRQSSGLAVTPSLWSKLQSWDGPPNRGTKPQCRQDARGCNDPLTNLRKQHGPQAITSLGRSRIIKSSRVIGVHWTITWTSCLVRESLK
jgi:hypothetical protein